MACIKKCDERTHEQTDEQPESNMPPHFFEVGGIINNSSQKSVFGVRINDFLLITTSHGY